MQYRRFGRNGPQISVITLGGMRYVHGWDTPREVVGEDTLAQCSAVVSASFARGINHIETAFGYGKSEHAYGRILTEHLRIPRERYVLMTKGNPKTGDEVRALVERQLAGLRTDRIDLYGWHGINTPEILASACAKGGPIEALHRLRDEGVIGQVGFSTHGPLDVIIDAIHTGLFAFVNLHYYYFSQRLRGAVDYANAKGLGVFIISPNDKGGRLFEPSERLRQLCAPLTPIQFNAKWCLKHPEITTLSFGFDDPAQLAELDGILPVRVPLTAEELAIQQRMDAALLADPDAAYEGWPLLGDASGIHIPEVLRELRMATCYGHEAFGRFRYNMFEDKGHWHPGSFATDERIARVDPGDSPVDIDVAARLAEAHRRFYRPKS
jgi:hypothetical protein